MATPWYEVSARVRVMLSDTGATPKWDDQDLLRYANAALVDMSTGLPRWSRQSFAVTSGTASLSVPDDMISVQKVEVDAGIFLNRYHMVSGRVLEPKIAGYVLFGREVLFYPPPTDDVTITLYGWTLYDPLVTSADVLTIPIWAELALQYLVCALAVEREEMKDAKLSRFATRRDKGDERDDNPITPLANKYRALYREQLEMLGARVFDLARSP